MSGMSSRSRAQDRPFVQTLDDRRSSLGLVTYLRVRTENYRQLTWDEVWQAFAEGEPVFGVDISNRNR